jgi:hypothetical protein
LVPDNILLVIEEQISKKGNLGYINLFSTFKNSDYDRDGLIYLKDWQKIV